MSWHYLAIAAAVLASPLLIYVGAKVAAYGACRGIEHFNRKRSDD